MSIFFENQNSFYEKKEIELLPLFKEFIRDTKAGRRLKVNGERIKPQTVRNYEEVFKLLSEFCALKGFEFKVHMLGLRNIRLSIRDGNRWKYFYSRFCNYLYDEKNCYDNYVGLVIRILKAFFRYLRRDRFLEIGEFYEKFYTPSEEIDIVALNPSQLRFLIKNQSFESTLSKRLQLTKDIFVFGCTVALRISDLFQLTFQNIRSVGKSTYLSVKAKKTGVRTTIRLPEYLVETLKKIKVQNAGSSYLFPRISLERLNANIKRIGELAGWCQLMPKVRYRRGRVVEQYSKNGCDQQRFCDRLSTHTMRRTAITTMLMLGMPELLVRKVSGHSPNSKEFYRYVNFTQSLMDNQIEKVYRKLLR